MFLLIQAETINKLLCYNYRRNILAYMGGIVLDKGWSLKVKVVEDHWSNVCQDNKKRILTSQIECRDPSDKCIVRCQLWGQ